MNPKTTVIGMDPSLTGFGISDGIRTIEISTGPREPDPGRSNGDAYRERFWKFRMEISSFLNAADRGFPFLVSIEAPALRVMGKGSGSHLYEMGWLMATIYETVYFTIGRARATILEVPVGTARKHLVGNGATGKNQIALAIADRYGVRIEKDRDLNKLEAWCLWRFGCDYRDDLVTVKNAKRGSGAGARAAQPRLL